MCNCMNTPFERTESVPFHESRNCNLYLSCFYNTHKYLIAPVVTKGINRVLRSTVLNGFCSVCLSMFLSNLNVNSERYLQHLTLQKLCIYLVMNDSRCI